MSREEAVIAYTFGNDFAEFAEHKKGTLTQGIWQIWLYGPMMPLLSLQNSCPW